jgi:hypothetical protein
MQFYQNPNAIILHRDRKINSKIHMKTQKPSNSQSNSEQKVQCWRDHNSQIGLQSHNNKNSMVLAQKQT